MIGDIPMHADTMLVYKLMILYMLSKLDFPLTNSEISEFFLEKEYTSFFNIQQAIHSLEDTGFVTGSQVRNMTHYNITPEGMESLDLFENKISEEFKEDITNFLKEKQYQLRNEVAITAEYVPASDHSFMVQCVIKEKKDTMLDLKLNVPSIDEAIAICDTWKEKSSTIYEYLVNELMLSSPSK